MREFSFKIPPFEGRFAELCRGNTLLSWPDPQNGTVIALVSVQLVMEDAVRTPGHRLETRKHTSYDLIIIASSICIQGN